ncbi:uncharacterized protein LOC125646470 [Ostrea edulis]|uniref:uncharacterized protein LOC125646470 n=1 Tax=Ostrea edulis TaxID=37623 RepID=UPI0020961B9A|nr:uncharacterized protein LOC125646470 [Ostrea edulis]
MTHFGDSCFWKSNTSLEFWKAEQICQKDGGHLASIPDSTTLSFIQHEFLSGVPTGNKWWIGIQYIKLNGTYVNMFNETQIFTQWDANEPYVSIFYIYVCAATANFEWFTSPCKSKYPAICSRRTACRGSELPMNRSTQLMQLFNVDVTEMIFEFEAEVNLRYGKLMVKMHCGSTGHWESDRRRHCLCPCSRLHVSTNNISVERKILKIKQELKLNKIQLSKTKRQKISSSDSRPSAFALGSVLGVGIIITFFLTIMICDLPSLHRQINSRHRINICR